MNNTDPASVDKTDPDDEPPAIAPATPEELEARARAILGSIGLPPDHSRGRLSRPSMSVQELKELHRQQCAHMAPLYEAYQARKRLYADRKRAKKNGEPLPPLSPTGHAELREQLLKTLPYSF